MAESLAAPSRPGPSDAETASPPLVFVTSVYGRSYAPFLTPHLESIAQAHSEAVSLVLWQGMPRAGIQALSVAYPRAQFVEIERPIGGDFLEQLVRKVGYWESACNRYPDTPLCFIDVDALVVKPISAFVQDMGRETDAIFTWKDEPYPLNLGVLLVRTGRVGRVVLHEWRLRTERLAADSRLQAQALAVSGDVSQHAFREMVGFANYDGRIARQIGGERVIFQGVACRLLNETNSVPISADTHIIHYKTGWHPILLGGAGYTAFRSEEKCAEMLRFWRRVAAEGRARLTRVDAAAAGELLRPAAETARRSLISMEGVRSALRRGLQWVARRL